MAENGTVLPPAPKGYSVYDPRPAEQQINTQATGQANVIRPEMQAQAASGQPIDYSTGMSMTPEMQQKYGMPPQPKFSEPFDLLTPSGKVVHIAPFRESMLRQAAEEQGKFILPTIIPKLFELIPQEAILEGKGRTYWENPQKIARYYEFVRNQPPTWQAPEWLDVKALDAAYKYLSYRNGKTKPVDWGYLPTDDPGTGFLQGMAKPPVEVLFDYELKQDAEAKKQEEATKAAYTAQLGAWDKQSWMQQMLQTVTSPQPQIGEAAQNVPDTGRPGWSVYIANLIRGGLSYMTGKFVGAGIGTMIGIGLTAAGVVVTAPVALIGGLIGGIGLGLAALVEASTGKRIPVIGDAADLLQPMSWASRLTEAGFGVGAEIAHDKTLTTILDNIPESIGAATATYETMPFSPIITPLIAAENLVKRAGKNLGLTNYEEVPLPKQGEVWRLEMGQREPTPLAAGILTGTEGIIDLREKLIAAKDQGNDAQLQIKANYIAQFGFQGTLNDFVLQSWLDPSNAWGSYTQMGAALWADNLKVLPGMSKAQINSISALKASFPYPTIANALVDQMPFPANIITTMATKVQGSQGILVGIKKYQTFINTGFYPGWKMPADYKEPAETTNLENTFNVKSPEDLVKADMATEKITGLTKGQTLIKDTMQMPSELTGIQKQLGNLDPVTGLPRYFMPEDKTLNAPTKIFNWLFQLTPASKVKVSYANITSHLERLFYDVAGGDLETFALVVKRLGQVNPETTGEQLAKIMQPAGEPEIAVDPRFFVSPIGMALAMSIRKIVESGKLDEWIATNWTTTTASRALLFKVSKLMGIKPGELLDKMVADEDITPILKQKALEAGIKGFDTLTKDALKNQLKVFTGEKALPFHPTVAYVELSNDLIKKQMGDFLVKRFGVTPDPKLTRFFHVLKSMQSILVLGFNPNYLINNVVNNVITRAYAGVGGFMTPKQIVSLLDRLGIDPTKPDLGLPQEVSRKDDFNPLYKAQKIAKPDNVDVIIDAAGKIAKDINKTVGIFSIISGKVERSEGRQAYTIGLLQMQDQLWKRNVAISVLPPEVPEEIANKLYGLAERSWNVDELEKNFFDPNSKLSVTEILDVVANAYADQHKNIIKDPAMVRDLLVRTGILADLETGLKAAKNDPASIKEVFDQVKTTLDNKVREMVATDIKIRAEATKNLVKIEGITAALSEITDVELDFAKEWMMHFIEWGDLMSKKAGMTSQEFGKLAYVQKAKDRIRFETLFQWEAETLKGVFEAIGYSKDLPEVKTILDAHDRVKQGWQGFYDYKEAEYDGLITGKYKTDDDWKVELKAVQDRVSKMASDTHDAEMQQIIRQNEAYIALAKDKELATAWRAEVQAIRQAMIDDMKQFRDSIKLNPPADQTELNARWNAFTNERYSKRIVELKTAESLLSGMTGETDGADIYDKRVQRIINEPIGDDLPEFVRQTISKEAANLLSELQSGEAGRRNFTKDANGTMVVSGIGSSNAQWYKDINARDGSVDRKAVANALQYLIDGKPNQNRYSQDMKLLIIGRVGGGLPHYTYGLDSYVDPGFAWYVGDKDGAAYEISTHYPNADDATYTRLFGSSQDAKDALEYWIDEYTPKQWIREKLAKTYEDILATGTTYRGLDEEHLDANMAMMQVMANRWAQATGKKPGEWWGTVIKDIISGEEQQLRGNDILAESYPKGSVLLQKDQATVNSLYQTGSSQPWYYFNSQRQIELMPNSMTPTAFKGYMNGRVKADEMHWNGLDEFIADKLKAGENITKQEALNYLNENKVSLSEVIKGTPPPEIQTLMNRKVEIDKQLIDLHGKIARHPSLKTYSQVDAANLPWQIREGTTNIEAELPFDLQPIAKEFKKISDELNVIDEQITAANVELPKYEYGNLVTPGKYGNYRELIISLDRPSKDAWIIVDKNDYMPVGKQSYATEERAKYEFNKIKNNENLSVIRATYAGENQTIYKAGHWEEANPLLHVRFDDRVVDGNLTLNLEEIQSDWHQAGKKYGYQQSLTQDESLELARLEKSIPNLYKEIQDAQLVERINLVKELDAATSDVTAPKNKTVALYEQINELDSKQEKRNLEYSTLNIRLKELTAKQTKGIPEAPLSKNWESVAIKRMIRWAVDGGYDQVAWTTGQTQAKRYGLSQIADRIEWYPDIAKGDSGLLITRKGAGETKNNINRSALSEWVGEDVAGKLNNPTKANTVYLGDLTGSYVEGDNLSVGGKGMRVFYDDKMVNVSNDLIKRYGSKVEDIDLGTTKYTYKVIAPYDVQVGENLDYQAAVRLRKQYGRGTSIVDAHPEIKSDQPIEGHSFKVTDAMRDGANTGQSLWQVDRDILNLAKLYGIPTATADGKPNNKQLLNTINKYKGDDQPKFDTLDDVPYHVALNALEKQRVDKGLPPVTQERIKGAVNFDADGKALVKLFRGADQTTTFHEIFHVYFRSMTDVMGDDLEVFSRWGGLKDADQYLRLRQQFENGTIQPADEKLYRDMVEKVNDGAEDYLVGNHANLPKAIQAIFQQFMSWLMQTWKAMTSNKRQPAGIDAEITLASGKKIKIKDAYDRLFVDTLGRKPLGTTPEPAYNGKAWSEVVQDNVSPLINAVQDKYITEAGKYKALSVADIPANLRPVVTQWINQLKGNMAAAKMASSSFATYQRNDALLDYSALTGFDTMASIAFPYQFWYTRTMMNYARRVFEKPSMYGWYYRYREMQKKMQADGVPARFYGKMRVPGAWLPEWAGGGLWIDPMKQIFPFSQMLDPINSIASKENSIKYATFKVLNEMVKDKLITQPVADDASASMTGAAWDQAYAIAVKQGDVGDPMSLAGMMMTPGMYLTIPYYLAKGQQEKISPTPLLRTSQAWQSALKGTVAEPVGNIIGAFGAPEKWVREQMMTPAKAMFGEFGDYYVGRNLANMVATGEVNLEEALKGISLHEGDAYQLGVQRTQEELSMKTPGILPVLAIKNSASIPDIAFSILVGLYPAGLLPEGELLYLKDKDEYSKAWDYYKYGDKTKLTDFFNKHPEYEARIALKAEPEEQLRQFLVSEIWDRYYLLDGVNKNVASKNFGDVFQTSFLEGETRNYEGISLETLARWAFQLGAYMPQTAPELAGVRSQITSGELKELDKWSPGIAAAYTAYQKARGAQFPNYYALQEQYYALPKNRRASFLTQFPELKQYWNWKAQYALAHPEIQAIMESNSADMATQPPELKQPQVDQTMNMQPELIQQLMAYFMIGTNPTPGAWMALQRAWEQKGKPYGDLGTWLEKDIKPSFQQ